MISTRSVWRQEMARDGIVCLGFFGPSRKKKFLPVLKSEVNEEETGNGTAEVETGGGKETGDAIIETTAESLNFIGSFLDTPIGQHFRQNKRRAETETVLRAKKNRRGEFLIPSDGIGSCPCSTWSEFRSKSLRAIRRISNTNSWQIFFGLSEKLA